MLKTYKACNSTIGFSKYEFYNNLLGGVILLRVTLVVTWTQPYIYIYIYILNSITIMGFKFLGIFKVGFQE